MPFALQRVQFLLASYDQNCMTPVSAKRQCKTTRRTVESLKLAQCVLSLHFGARPLEIIRIALFCDNSQLNQLLQKQFVIKFQFPVFTTIGVDGKRQFSFFLELWTCTALRAAASITITIPCIRCCYLPFLFNPDVALGFSGDRREKKKTIQFCSKKECTKVPFCKEQS